MIDVNGIMAVLPHRPPFLLIDRIISCEPGVSCVAEKGVTMNEPFFVGHFPGHPVMPGVLIIEALAQAGGYAILSMPENKGKLAFFAAVDKVKWRKQVTPGGILRLEVEIIKLKGPAGVGKGIATFDGEKACEAELTFFLQ
ncbi:MAG: 3-hydroxyacyl-ACP dehydratase FabZ [Defluviitaleaceae bacterium]|nr:3-hydroxyacyl-ACP dehydratase FabZ [Defluviitaleaceae bacterium]